MRAFATIKNPGSGATRAGDNALSWSGLLTNNEQSNQICATSQ